MDSPTIEHPPDVLRMLADDVRWRLVRALARSDRRVRELVDAIGAPYNLVSYHLKQLHKHRLVDEHRSSRDGRDVYYSLNLDQLRDSFLFSADSLHPAIRPTPTPELLGDSAARTKPRVLILCTHNSSRSQMAEGVLRSMSNDSIDVASAGSEPTTVNPEAIAAMERASIDISHQHSKSMEEFSGQTFDYVITVCDSVREVCPAFPGDPERIHWSFPDPSEVPDPSERQRAFEQTILGLTNRFRHLITLIDREREKSDQ
jgi:ArsR family transcriptional regulator, arsenate/arsenite/antimonite-responsive transcriptional repressor / arsenate reductase (thioredoxin)